ncbi:MAG TPA: nuclear transport factor 2 family protein [Caulobacter sp.]|nr:nuclear transport factor 2 family protein [Caulobacter sp.]
MTDANEQSAIRRAIDAWTRGLHDKDVEAAVASLADDFVRYSLAPPLGSTGANRAGLQAWFDTWSGPIGYVLADLDIAASGDVALAHGLGHLTGTKTDGAVTDLWFRATLGLRKQGRAWKIVHLHESVPFLMDGSLKAAVELQP